MVDEKIPENYGGFLSNGLSNAISYLYDTNLSKNARYYGNKIYEAATWFGGIFSESIREEKGLLTDAYNYITESRPIQTTKEYVNWFCEPLGIDTDCVKNKAKISLTEAYCFIYEMHLLPTESKKQKPEKPTFSEVFSNNMLSEGRGDYSYTIGDFIAERTGRYFLGPSIALGFYAASIFLYPKLLLLPLVTNASSLCYEVGKNVKKRISKQNKSL